MLLVSCVTETKPAYPFETSQPREPEQQSSRVTARDHGSLDVTASLVPFGSIPCDDLSLPIVSPDGQFVATQVGLPPTFPTLRAEPDATVPTATSIEIYRIDLRTGIDPAERKQPEFVASINDPVILGRACDESGFLIEAPQDDGARWIGLASWNDGTIRWLVRDEFVNAFASLGSDGRLAWSRRAVDGDMFELVVRRAGAEWSFSTGDSEWLYPTWGGRGDGLFVLQLTEARLYAAYMNAADRQSISRTLQRKMLASGADRGIAFQTLTGQVTSHRTIRVDLDQLLFVHPSRLRIALWRPTARKNDPLIFLSTGSFAATAQERNWAIVSSWRELERQSLVNPEQTKQLLSGIAIPRVVTHPDLHYVLLQVNPQSGQIGLFGLKLLPTGADANR